MAVVEQRVSQSRVRRLTPLAIGTGIVLLLTVALHFRDPHESGSWGFCPWLIVTGTYCPGCGGLRAVNNLTDGDLKAAMSSNLLFVASLPFVAVLWVRALVRAWRGEPKMSRRTLNVLIGVLVAVSVVFWVVRNLPFATYLAP